MNVAVSKTKAEQALAEAFSGVAARAARRRRGRARCAREAIARFAALGLPHRRVEAWKYTDLRNLHEGGAAAGGAQGGAGDRGRRRSRHSGRSPRIDAHRVVFVDGVYRADLSTLVADGAGDRRLAGARLSPMTTTGDGAAARRRRATTTRVRRTQHRLR